MKTLNINSSSKMKSHMKISSLVFTCSKHMYSGSGNNTLDNLFYKKQIEIKTLSAILTESKGVAFSLLFSIDQTAPFIPVSHQPQVLVSLSSHIRRNSIHHLKIEKIKEKSI